MTGRAVLGKALPKQVSFIVSVALTCGLLVSCTNQSEEAIDPVLAANCERILSNLETLHDRPEVFPRSDVADAASVALLLGEESRAIAETKILAKFPFLDGLISGKIRKNQRSDFDLLYAGTIFLVQEALVGTDIEFPYSTDEVLAIATDEGGWENVVSPMVKEIFGEYYGANPLQGCAIFEVTMYDNNADNNTSVAIEPDNKSSVTFEWATNDYIDFAEFLQAIRNCEKTGWHEQYKCSEEDYVSDDDYDYTTSDVKTPEELEILEERERKAQNEKKEEPKSSQDKEVRPLQICYTAFVVVPTEKYGDLTCRPVLVNKIRTLMWMK
jgi:hypothetical protein